jgi:hypothetical protein
MSFKVFLTEEAIFFKREEFYHRFTPINTVGREEMYKKMRLLAVSAGPGSTTARSLLSLTSWFFGNHDE